MLLQFRSLKPSERLRTPTYEIDTYRPYTHRATGAAKRSELYDKRFRETRTSGTSILMLDGRKAPWQRNKSSQS